MRIQNHVIKIYDNNIVVELVKWLLQNIEFSQDTGSYKDKRLIVKMFLECFELKNQ